MPFLLLLAAHAAAGEAALSGRWKLQLERPGMQPRCCKGSLTLGRTGGRWRGSLRFDRILHARGHELTAVDVKGERISFRVEHPQFALVFRGKRDGDELKGDCDWKGLGRYTWFAKREPPVPPQERFDPGLDFPPDLPRGEAERLGLDGPALDRLLAAADAAHSHALVILKDGHIVSERYFGRERRKIPVMSVTKFVTAMAVALLLDEKRIPSLDAPLSTWFPEWKKGRKAKLTLRHVLAHTSGLRHGRNAQGRPDARELNRSADKVAYARSLPVVEEPGAKFAYNNEAIALLSGIVRQSAGGPLDRYVDERLFRPLGIRDWAWRKDEAGNPHAYADLVLHARDLARIGLLVACGGKWRGRQVFPARWIHILGDEPGSPHNDRCGLVWWRLPGPGYYHDGWLGQALVVLPKQRLVAVRLRGWDGTDAPERSFSAFCELVRETLVR